jgi:hypothetical protein
MPPFMGFKSKAECKAVVQEELRRFEVDEAFMCPLVSDLIATHHYELSREGVRPVWFRKRRSRIGEPGPYQFEAAIDGHGWRGVSWTKCISPPTPASLVAAGLRRRVQPEINAAWEACEGICVECRSQMASEMHHRSPSFGELLERFIGGRDPESILVGYGFWNCERWVVPDSDPNLADFLRDHAACELVPMCKDCHRKQHGSLSAA